MRRDLTNGLQVASAALVTSGYLALATTPRYSVSIVLLPLILFLFAPLAERLDGRFPLYRRVSFALAAAYCIFIPISLFFFDLLGSVVGLVIFIQAYTLLHRKRVNNYHHLYLMSFFLLLAACVLSPDASIGLAMLLFLVSAIVSLIVLHLNAEAGMAPEGRGPEIRRPGVEDIAVSETPRRVFDAGLIATISAVVLASLVVTAALFYVTPRMEAGLLGRTDPFLFRPAVSQTVDLARGGLMVRDQTAVMRVEFPDEPERRYEGPLFWRTTTLDFYVEPHWERRNLSSIREEPYFALDRRGAVATGAARAEAIVRAPFRKGRLVRQSIYMDDVPEEGMPCLPIAQQIKSTGNNRGVQLGWDNLGDFTAQLNRPGKRWLQYDVWSEVQEFTPEQLRAAKDNYAEMLNNRDYQVLTHHNLDPETQTLAAQIADGRPSVYDKALAVGAYLNSGAYAYSLNVPPLGEKHPVDTFINVTKVGHCELFASAMALMLRSVGIPTRVVGGYRGGEWSDSDKAYIVRADMAHLWVEVYFLGLGWVTFDPSPANDLTDAFSTQWLARLVSRYVLKAKMVWYRDILGFDRRFQVVSLRNLALGIIGLGTDLFDSYAQVRAGPGRGRGPLLLVAIAAFGIGVLFFRFVRGRRGRVYRHLLTEDQARAVRLYMRLRHKLEHLGLTPVGKTAEEIRAELSNVPAFHVGPVLEVIDTYNEVRFGGRPLARDRYAYLRGLVQALRPSDPRMRDEG